MLAVTGLRGPFPLQQPEAFAMVATLGRAGVSLRPGDEASYPTKRLLVLDFRCNNFLL